MFKYTIDGKEVTADQFISYYNSCINKAENNKRKFIIIHKNIHPSLKVVIPIDEIQSIVEREDGCATIRLKDCDFINYDTTEKYDEIIRQLL